MKNFILFALILCATTTYAMTPFASELFGIIAEGKSTENVVFSPVSIQSCLAMTYLGAEGETANQMRTGLRLANDSKETVAQGFGKLLARSTSKTDGAKLKIANRIYLGQKFTVAPQFNDLVIKYFRAGAENVKFSETKKTAKKISRWVSEQTEHKIRNLITADSLDGGTAAVLVNAIYFHANWTLFFDGLATKKQKFSLSKTQTKQVSMMSQTDRFLYGELEDIDAKVVELTYENTDVTMLVILPNEIDGLANLETKLRNVDLTKISSRLKKEKVNLSLPKFKIEFDISLKPALEKLGMNLMFTTAADFSSLTTSTDPMAITEVKHKAFIEVNEMGTEAAGATYAKAYLLSLSINEIIYDFLADHPFFFAIKDTDYVYFAGHVAHF